MDMTKLTLSKSHPKDILIISLLDSLCSIYAINYNVLKIEGGMGGIMFSN